MFQSPCKIVLWKNWKNCLQLLICQVDTNFQIETAAAAFLCGYLIMKITEAIHGCDYCLSHLRDPNSKKKIPLLELMYY
jgi:hypothetical protein